MKENKEIEAVVLDSENNSFDVKKEKIYKKKDLIITAIIAFLIGAIVTAGGCAISKTIKGGREDRLFRNNGIHRNIEEKEFENSQAPNGNQGRMIKRGNRPNMNGQSTQNPNNDNLESNQTSPSAPNNAQQPNSLPNDNQNSESNKS